ncbi:MAG: transporter [Candidatus Eisenbacteria bacterium]|nr:transporter [Candidatus Eisenbacteria bacterium]
MNARFASWITIAAAAALPLARSAAADPWLLAPGDHYYQLGGSYFSADSYHRLGGDRAPLDGGGLHEEKAVYSYNEFGWKKSRTLILGFPYLSVTRRGGAASAGSGRTETGFGDLLAGVRWRLHEGPAALSLETDWIAPLGYDSDLSPRLGDGSSSISGALQYGMPVASRGFLELEGGYRYFLYPKSPTDQMLAGATLGIWLGRSLLIAGRYEGKFGGSSGDTIYRALPGDAVPGTTDDQITTHLAGPVLVYRVDDHIDLIGGSMHTASAKNALHIDRFYVAVAMKQTRLNRLQGLLGGTR